jgi:hypothetical protein
LTFKFLAEKYAPRFIEGNVSNWFIHFVLVVIFTSFSLYLIKRAIPKYSRYLVGV